MGKISIAINGKQFADIDEGIASFVMKLNEMGFITLMSCSGMKNDHRSPRYRYEAEEDSAIILFDAKLSPDQKDSIQKVANNLDLICIRYPEGTIRVDFIHCVQWLEAINSFSKNEPKYDKITLDNVSLFSNQRIDKITELSCQYCYKDAEKPIIFDLFIQMLQKNCKK